MSRAVDQCAWCGNNFEKPATSIVLAYDVDEVQFFNSDGLVHRHVKVSKMPDPMAVNGGPDGGRITLVGSYTLPD